jgi:hypothetical protein
MTSAPNNQIIAPERGAKKLVTKFLFNFQVQTQTIMPY